MSQQVNFKWPVGEDLILRLVYKEGENASKAKAVDLSGSYSLRMAIGDGTSILHTFESTDGTLGNGLDRQPNINIVLPRALTLTGGALHNKSSVQYDIFLRNTVTDRQFKVLRGSITFERSVTLWA